MSAERKEKRAPYFTTSEMVDIDIDPEELEAAGWVYVGKGDKSGEPKPDETLAIVRRWHDDTHEGPWQWCQEQPCDTLRGRPHDGRES